MSCTVTVHRKHLRSHSVCTGAESCKMSLPHELIIMGSDLGITKPNNAERQRGSYGIPKDGGTCIAHVVSATTLSLWYKLHPGSLRSPSDSSLERQR